MEYVELALVLASCGLSAYAMITTRKLRKGPKRHYRPSENPPQPVRRRKVTSNGGPVRVSKARITVRHRLHR